VLQRRLGRTAWKLCATPAHINRLVFKAIGEVTLLASVQVENGEALPALVLGGMGVARLSEYMVAEDLAEGRLVELFPGQLDTAPPYITARYLTRTSGQRRLAVVLDWLREVLPGVARGASLVVLLVVCFHDT
jgi:DNA-binding transcriptional LysR family regulator